MQIWSQTRKTISKRENSQRLFSSLQKVDKLVSQKIIAHVQNPKPHIIITVLFDNENRLISDTCVEIKIASPELEHKFLLGFYQSSFCNWYAYNLIYNRAIRTMDFIDYYITQIPIPKCIVANPTKQKALVFIVDKILSITKDEDYFSDSSKKRKVEELQENIDQLVYDLFEFTNQEIAIVEGQI